MPRTCTGTATFGSPRIGQQVSQLSAPVEKNKFCPVLTTVKTSGDNRFCSQFTAVYSNGKHCFCPVLTAVNTGGEKVVSSQFLNLSTAVEKKCFFPAFTAVNTSGEDSFLPNFTAVNSSKKERLFLPSFQSCQHQGGRGEDCFCPVFTAVNTRGKNCFTQPTRVFGNPPPSTRPLRLPGRPQTGQILESCSHCPSFSLFFPERIPPFQGLLSLSLYPSSSGKESPLSLVEGTD